VSVVTGAPERTGSLTTDLQAGPGRSASLVIVAGFSLAIVTLLVSGYLGIQAMEGSEERAARLLQEQQISNRLIDEIQGEEASLSGLFYQLASPAADRAALVVSLDTIEHAVGRTLQSALTSPKDGRWGAVKSAVEAYIAEMRHALAQPGDGVRTTEALFDKHEVLVSAMANLVAANYEETLLAQQDEFYRSRSLLGRSLIILGFALVLALASAAGTVYLSNQMFHRIRWQAQELSRLSGHVLERQETVIRSFSRELHDELGQTLTDPRAARSARRLPAAGEGCDCEDARDVAVDASQRARRLRPLSESAEPRGFVPAAHGHRRADPPGVRRASAGADGDASVPHRAGSAHECGAAFGRHPDRLEPAAVRIVAAPRNP
jgi:hypothetical protein